MALEIMELETDDPEVAHETLNDAYGPDGPMRVSGDPANFACRLRHVTAGEVDADRVRHSMIARASMSPVGYFLTNTVLRGSFDEVSVGGIRHRARPGQTILTSQPAELTAVWNDIDVATLRLPFTVVDRVARERLGHREPVRFGGLRPISAEAERRWGRLTRRVHDETRASSSMLEEPLICAQFAELIAATALATFENSAERDSRPAARRPVAPTSVRLAQAYIEANASLAINLTDIAAAAGVTPRALQYGFSRHLEMSPMAYLRQTRLRAVHADLQEADLSGGVTVDEIARRWGFGDSYRFAAHYRNVYGRAPSETLRS